MGTSSLQSRRVWIGGGAVFAAIIAAACWFLLISPELSAADSLHSQAASQRSQNLGVAQKVAQLKAKSAHLPTYIASLRHALEALPSDSGMAAFTRQVHALSAKAGVTVDGITVGTIAPASAAAAPATSGTDSSTSGSTSTSSTTDSSGSTSTSSTTDSSSTSTTTTTTTNGATPGTLYAIPLTVTSEGNFGSQHDFLEALRAAGPRYGLVTSVQFSPSAGAKEASVDGANTMTTQVTVFSEPLTSAQIDSLVKLLHGDIGS